MALILSSSLCVSTGRAELDQTSTWTRSSSEQSLELMMVVWQETDRSERVSWSSYRTSARSLTSGSSGSLRLWSVLNLSQQRSANNMSSLLTMLRIRGSLLRQSLWSMTDKEFPSVACGVNAPSSSATCDQSNFITQTFPVEFSWKIQ